MLPSQGPNVSAGHQWANPNPQLSVEHVTVSSSSAMNNLSRSNPRPQMSCGQSFPYKLGQGNFGNNDLPELSAKDLQCLDSVAQAAGLSQPESQTLYHQQRQRTEHASALRSHLQNQNQGVPTAWPNYNTLNPLQNPFNGSVPGGGGGGTLSFLEEMEREDFLKDLVGGESQPTFHLKQEPQMTVGQESQGNTYINLLPCTVVNSSSMDPLRQARSGNTQPQENLHNPKSHYPTLADYINSTSNRQSN